MEILKGYRSLDGGAEVNLNIAVNQDLFDLWDETLLHADIIDFVCFDSKLDLYYSVSRFVKTAGNRVYAYKVNICDAAKNNYFVVLLDRRGGAKVEIHYAAQRDSQQLNLTYRKWFEFVHLRIIKEQMSRVDLAITIAADASSIINDCIGDKMLTCLSRKSMEIKGIDKPTYLRFGDLKGVQVCIYDKSLEVEQKSFKLDYRLKYEDFLKYFRPFTFVTRIEYRVGRRYLRNCGWDSPDDVNKDIMELWDSMTSLYFCPTSKVNDHKHKTPVADWWSFLPPVVLSSSSTDFRNNNFNGHLADKRWHNQYKMMMSRALGYISSIVASMARVESNVDNALNVIYRRIWRSEEEIRRRALTRFVIQ